jgi:conjugative element/phage-associated large polyvalent protein
MGAYDDIIRALPQVNEAAPGAPTEGPYADIIREMGQDVQTQAQGANVSGADAKPDTAGRAAELSKSVGVPASVVESDLPEFERQHQIARNDAAMRANPPLAQWAAQNPQDVRVAHDDFDKLDVLSKAITAAKKGFESGELGDALARVGYAQMRGGPEAKLYEVTDREKWLKNALSRPDGVDGTFYNMVKSVSGFVGGLYSMSERPAYLALGGAAVGSAVPVIGTAVGAGAGFVTGMVREGFETGAGALYNTLKNEKDANGDSLDPSVVRGAALSGGIVLGLLNAANVSAVNKPFAEAAQALIPALARKLVERPTIAVASRKFVAGLAESAVTGAAFGALAEATTVATENLAKEIDSGTWATMFNSEVERSKAIDRIASSAADMALNFAALHVPARGLGLAGDLARARESSSQRAFIDALADGSAQAKTRERSPSVFENFIAAQTKGTPVENLFIPAEQVLKLYQDAKIDPEKPETDHLFPFVKDMGEQLKQAAPVGGDVVIKTSDYATYLAGTELDGKLRDHLKVGPDAMSMADAKQFFQDYKKELGDRAKEYEKDLESPADSADRVKTEVQKQLTDVGYKTRTAGGMAAQMAAFFRTIGSRIGIDPYELFSKYGLKVQRPELQTTPEGAMEQPVYHGSPHIFDKFELQKIGSGEGAQAYGWGLYFASNKEVAKYYRDALSKQKIESVRIGGEDTVHIINSGRIHGRKVTDLDRSAIEVLESENVVGDIDAAIEEAKARVEEYRLQSDEFGPGWTGEQRRQGLKEAKYAGDVYNTLLEFKKWGVETDAPKGRVYHVEIPEHENFLNLDVPLSEQPEPVQKALKKAGHMPEISERSKLAAQYQKLIDHIMDVTDGGIANIELIKASLAESEHAHPLGEKAEIRQILKGNGLMEDAKKAVVLWDKVEALKGTQSAYDYNVTGKDLYQELSGELAEDMRKGRDPTSGPIVKWLGINEAENGGIGGKGFDTSNMSPEEITSRYLNNIGIPGVSYLEGASRKKGKGNYNYVLFDDSHAKITGYEQERRGYISFGADRKVSISLLEKADLSTFLHESGHMYLEVLRDLTKEPGDSELHRDMEALRTWMGVKPGEEIEVKHHEKFARGFEAYLMEGKAPSAELRGAFARFRQWLTTIYQDITGLGVRLTDEVRDVFDRMLASSDEIAQARRAERLEALFTDAKQAGMTDAEFNAYKNSIRRMSRQADEALINKTMEDIRRRRTKEYRASERGVREEITKAVDDRPEIQALNYLRGGVLLDRKALESMYGRDIATGPDRTLPVGIKTSARGGVHPDEVAERSGFGSGDAMIKALSNLAQQEKLTRKDIREYMIDQDVRDHMAKYHGDALRDGSIRDEAISVLHTADQAEILATELRALGRTSKRPPMPYQVARDWAKNRIAGMKIMDATREWKYARDEAKAARATEKALLAGDRSEAYRQKQLQLLNHVLYMEARTAHEEVDSGGAKLDRYARAESIKNLDQDYLEQIHGLLERFDFKAASGKEIGRRAALRDWVQRQEADGEEIKIPETYLNDAFRKHYTELTMDEFRGLVDSVENLAHIGRLKSTLLDGAQRRAFEDVVAEAVDAAGRLPQRETPTARNPGQGGRGLDRVDAKFLRAGVTLRSLDAALLKMEQVFDWLDSADPKGIFNRIVFRRIADAQTKENDLRLKITKQLNELNAKMPDIFREEFNVRHEIPELPDSRTGKPSHLLKREILAIALNMGNASNKDKMLRGEKWSESAVQGVLDHYMGDSDRAFVRGIFDIMESLWPEIEAMEKRLSGVAPKKVEGDYYPIIYDPLRSPDVELRRQKASDQLFENNYQRATTPHGYTIERVEKYARPLYLSLDVIPRHLAQVAHDLAYREAVMDADRFLANSEVKAAVESSLGREVYQQFRPWLQAIANDRVYDERGLAFWDKMAHSARTTATMVGLGFRLTTMMIHGLTAASNSIGELGPRWMLSGINAFFGTPEKMAQARDFIFDRSGEMRNRMNSIDRDVRDGLRDLEGQHGIVYSARRFAYYGISALDMASALPTWMGAYNKALHEGMAEQDAIYTADKAVRVAHGAGDIKDLPAIQRGSEFQKLFTMFYSFWSHFYNRQRDLARRAGAAAGLALEGDVKGAARDFSMVLARSAFYFILPQIIHAALRTKGKDEEDKSFAALAAEEIGLGFFAGIPIVRDVAHAAFLGKDYEATPAASIVKSFAATAKDVTAATGIRDAEVSDKWLRHAIETAGYTFGLPLGQPAGSVQFLWDVMNGTADPEGLREWMHGITYGKLPSGE